MMKQFSLIALLLGGSVFLTACGQQEKSSENTSDASAVQVEQVSSEQQAAIDSVDKPILDEKNTDVPAEVANAPADAVSAHQDHQ